MTASLVHQDSIDVIAHRGASAHAPENTLAAVDLAADLQAHLVEVDVQLTKDGHPVVIHDTTLRRTTDVRSRFPGRGPCSVADLTLAEIRALDAGSWFDARYAGAQVPTLQEVLDTLRGRAGLLLEVKAPNLYPGIAEAVATVLDGEGWLRAGPQAPRLVVQSFDWDFMRRFTQLAPGVCAGLLGGPPARHRFTEPPTWASQRNRNHRRVTGRFVDMVHRHGMVTWPYTVDDPNRMRALIDLGVDGIITNRPDVLLDVLAQPARCALTA
jgi:glycerophosphoryl diester phosphodiesterase